MTPISDSFAAQVHLETQFRNLFPNAFGSPASSQMCI